MTDPASTHWHVDKRVPLASLAVFIVQTIAIVWYVSAWTANVTNYMNGELAARNQLVARVDRLETGASDTKASIVRQETLLQGLSQRMDRQESMLQEILNTVKRN